MIYCRCKIGFSGGPAPRLKGAPMDAELTRALHRIESQLENEHRRRPAPQRPRKARGLPRAIRHPCSGIPHRIRRLLDPLLDGIAPQRSPVTRISRGYTRARPPPTTRRAPPATSTGPRLPRCSPKPNWTPTAPPAPARQSARTAIHISPSMQIVTREMFPAEYTVIYYYHPIHPTKVQTIKTVARRQAGDPR